ncbi:IS110 family transposase [Leifsonia sp. McL0607]|uniref:IS110 family transposase n=1 Tax=Leifsonia sp. McL0607 TaxID=3415672 RepID=UPI003CF6550D
MPQIWAGIDAGKTHHHCVVVDEEGKRLLSRKIANDESEILALLSEVAQLADGAPICWATDMAQGGAALLISILLDHGQPLLYLPGRAFHHAARSYRGEGKTDAKDAGIIADQARMRRDLLPLRTGDQISINLRMLTGRRTDLVCDRTRAINRLRATLLEYFPALEAAFDYSTTKTALVLLSEFQTPERLREFRPDELADWIRGRGGYFPNRVAKQALTAAHSQHTTVAAQQVGASIVARLAEQVLELRDEIAAIDAEIQAQLAEHQHAEGLLSVPGFGPLLAAEFLAATGGDMNTFETADRLASIAGLAPAPHDSGRVAGNLQRPRRYNRRLLRACFMAAQVAAAHCPVSKAFYQRKRKEGKNHKQAVLCLARRRINVIWAILRDGKLFTHQPLPAPV